MFSIDYT